MADIIAYTDSMCKGPSFDHELQYPVHPSVPFQYTFRSGKQVSLRSMRRDETEYVFRLFQYCAREGTGYSCEEIPTLQYCKEHVLTHCSTVILEELATGKRIGAILTSPSWYNRSKSNPLGDLDIIFDPEFKGNGNGLEFQALGMALVKACGYKGLFSDIFESNMPVVKTSIKNKFSFVGVLPRTALLKGKGWTDSLFCYRDCEDIVSLDEMIRISSTRSISKL